MTAPSHAKPGGDAAERQGSARTTIKRRGVIAGAAALVTGLVAARTAVPVAAGTDGDIALNVFTDISATTGVQAKDNLILGGFSAGNWRGSPVLKGDASLLPDNQSYAPGGLYNVDGIQGLGKGTGTGVVGTAGANSGIGVYGFGAGTAAGVQGFGGNLLGAPGVVGVGNSASANNAEGVRGFGANGGVGVSGRGGATNATGVIGFGGGTGGQGMAGIGAGTGPGLVGIGGNFVATNNADGVQGFANGTGAGVVGHGGAANATGMIGFGGGTGGQGMAGIGSGTGPGVVGVGGGFVATNNADGVQGFANGTGAGISGQGGAASGPGVYGAGGGPHGTGVVGTSTGGYGMVGSTSAAGYSGLTGITGTAGVAALAATATVTTAYAAYFQGTTVVQGNFAVTGNKSAAVPHPDGTHRLLYCVESPEAWFEDFGEGKIVGGTVEINLDPDFAAVIETGGYHVFLTAHDESHNLAATRRAATGFTVVASPSASAFAGGKKAGDLSGTFSWRVVAKRKGNSGKRLEKFTVPQIKTPDIASLIESAKPLAPPVAQSRLTPAVVKPAETPVMPDVQQPTLPKKP
jgi:hypothetical protein